MVLLMGEVKQNLSFSNDSCFKLPSVLDISYAPSLHENLKEFLHLSNDICLEASGVSRITTPCIQVLIAFYDELKSKGVEVRILNPSENFCKIMVDLGLGQHEITNKYIAG